MARKKADVIRINMGERIRAARKAKGMSQMQVGLEVGVWNEIVSRWENDENNPCAYYTRRLAEVLEVTTDHLLGLEPASMGEAVEGRA